MLKDKIFITNEIYFDIDRDGIFQQSSEIKLVDLTPIQRRVLKCLCAHYGDDPINTETVAEYVYGKESAGKSGKSNTDKIRNEIHKLKQKINSPTTPQILPWENFSPQNGKFQIKLCESPFEEEYKPGSIAEFCKLHGIIEFSDQGINMRPFLESKKDIYVVATTGANLISNWEQNGFIADQLKKGTNFTILLANKHSEFTEDVYSIEQYREIDMAFEFKRVITCLQKAFIEVQEAANGSEMGKIHIGCTFSLLRQTITLGVDNQNEAWGWFSLTLPPTRTESGTTSFAFEGNTKTKKTFAYDTFEHIQALIKEAQKREGTWVEVTPNINPQTFYFRARYPKENQPAIRKDWEQMVVEAQRQMKNHQDYRNILIEVAAQHPLEPNGEPGKEFKLRLDYAAELYKKLKKSRNQVHIYIPGSIHKPDKISLSEAGKIYLLKHYPKIPETDIIGDEANQKYKGKDGVYNSADECKVAAELFSSGDYRQLHSVCSTNQLIRKKLFYLQFGVIPMFHTVSLDPADQTDSHDFLYEVFEALPDVLYRDQNWQDPDSLDAIRTREGRQPGYIAKKILCISDVGIL